MLYLRKTKKSDDVTLAHSGNWVSKSMELLVPIVECENNRSIKIKCEILKSPCLSIYFHTYQYNQRHLSGSYVQFDSTRQFNSLQFDMPGFVAILFQIGRDADDQLKNEKKSITVRKKLNLFQGESYCQ